MPLLKIKNLNFYAKSKKLLHNINIELDHGQRLGIFGPSGSGKSSLLKAISFFYESPYPYTYTGEIQLNQQRIHHISADIVLLQQTAILYPHLKIRAQFLLIKQENIEQDIIDWSEKLGISHLLDRDPAFLSGGEIQRVNLLRAILLKPKVLLLDEPFAHLDRSIADALQQDLLSWLSITQITSIWVSHSLEEIQRLNADMMILSQGQCLQYGKINDILQSPKSLDVCRILGGFNLFPQLSMAIPQDSWKISLSPCHIENAVIFKVEILEVITLRYYQEIKVYAQDVGIFVIRFFGAHQQWEKTRYVYSQHIISFTEN